MSLFCVSFARTNFREFRKNANFENFARTYFREFRECRPNSRENEFSRKLALAKISTFKLSFHPEGFQSVLKFRALRGFWENFTPNLCPDVLMKFFL